MKKAAFTKTGMFIVMCLTTCITQALNSFQSLCSLQEIQLTETVDVINPDHESVLSFATCTRKDTALYRITVTNQFGSDHADIELVVLG